jgi:hypothetical protein
VGLIVAIIPIINPHTGFTIISVGLAGATWMVVSLKHPLWSFNIVLFVFLLAYARLKLGVIDVEGPGNRGGIVLGDVLWATMIIAWGALSIIPQRKFRLRIPAGSLPLCGWAMLPFVALASGLPIAGLLFGGWPFSYAIPGLRQLQWASFAILGYSLVRFYGAVRVLRGIIVTVAVATFAHTIYGLVQLGYSLGWLDRAWVRLDDIFVMQNVNSWFYYPRLTGLLVNPNSYGLYGAFIFIFALALIVTKSSTGRQTLSWTMLMFGVFALLFSASRSALLGLGTSITITLCAALSSPRLMTSILKIGIPLIIISFIVLIIIYPLIPVVLEERFLRFFQVFLEGVNVDPNAIGRVEMWRDLWHVYITRYPLGTWVPTSYATDSAVDSFYVITAVQGTPLFTLIWLIFLWGAMIMGWRSYRKARVPLEAAAGLTLLGWSGIMAGGGLTLSPMLHPDLIAPFWTLIGVLVCCQRERRYSSVDNIPNHRPGLRWSGDATGAPGDRPQGAQLAGERGVHAPAPSLYG